MNATFPTLTLQLLLCAPVVLQPATLDLAREADLLDCAAANGCRFNGVQEGFRHIPPALLFTDLQPGSPAFGGTFTVRIDADPAAFRLALWAQREAFAGAPDAGFFESADRA